MEILSILKGVFSVFEVSICFVLVKNNILCKKSQFLGKSVNFQVQCALLKVIMLLQNMPIFFFRKCDFCVKYTFESAKYAYF